MIPTKNEIIKVVEKTNKQKMAEARIIANQVIERASDLLREGKFTLNQAPLNNLVIGIVKSEFQKAGWTVKEEISTHRSVNKNTPYEKRYVKLNFSMEGLKTK